MQIIVTIVLVIAALALIPVLIVMAVLIHDDPMLVRLAQALLKFSKWLEMYKIRYQHQGRHVPGRVRKVTNVERLGLIRGWAHCT